MNLKLFIVLFSIILCSCIRIDTGKNDTKKENYKGIITKIYQDDKEHYMYTFEIKTNTIIFNECAQLWPKSWEYAKVGDSIIKKKDTLMITIKKNDSTYREFEYKF
jgi:hypothetical protein